MNMQSIRGIAKEHAIKAARLNKVQLIREIQKTEGNIECFATDIDGSCSQMECLWRDDCVKEAKKLAS